MSSPAVQTMKLAVGRGRQPVLRDVSMTVAAGESLALVGANGSGKTTLLRALAGLDPPLAGEIRWQGGPLPRGGQRVRHVGVLFQGERAAALSVRDMVTLGLGLDHPASPPQFEVVDASLARFGLTELTSRACTRLSGGEWQRATLARALVPSPHLLLLDEPTNHLDPARRAALLETLISLRSRVAVVLATHDLDCATACDRVALISHGRLAALGPPADVLTPAHLSRSLGVRIRRLEDPQGGRPFLRVDGST